MVRDDKIMKKYLLTLAFSALLLLAIPFSALASNISNALYWANIAIVNSGAVATNVVTTANISTTNLINGNYMNATATNIVVRTSSGADVAFMPGYTPGGYPWCLFVPNIGANTILTDILYTANSTGGYIVYCPGNAGMTTPSDNVTLPVTDNFTISQTGWIDTDNGTADKNLVYKKNAFRTFISDTVSGNITSTIPGTATTTNTSPTSATANGWADPENAYDDNTGTWSSYTVATVTWTPYLELHLADNITCTNIYYYNGDQGVDITTVEIDVYYGGGWVNIYSDTQIFDTFVTATLTSLQAIEDLRIRFYNAALVNREARVYEAWFGASDWIQVTALNVSSGNHTITTGIEVR